MNPKIAIAVDAKNKAVATITGMATVGAKVDVEITGLPGGIPDWEAGDKWVGKSVRFRIVNEAGRDLVRFPLVEKTETADNDKWTVVAAVGSTPETYKTNNGTATTPEVDFNTVGLRREMGGVPFNEYREFGIIIDSIVDAAQYAVGKIKIRQWSTASTEDPTVLPDWRETLAQLRDDLDAVEDAKEDAESAAGVAETFKDAAQSASSSAIASAQTAVDAKDLAVPASSAAVAAKGAAETAQSAAETAQAAAEAAAEIAKNTSPYVGDNGNWFEYDADSSEYVDTGVHAKGDTGDKGDKGDKGDDGVGVPSISSGDEGKVLKVSSGVAAWRTETAGTVTGVKVNGSTKSPVGGVVDIGTVLTNAAAFDAAGSASTAQSAAIAAAASDATSKANAAQSAAESTASSALSSHEANADAHSTMMSGKVSKSNNIPALGENPTIAEIKNAIAYIRTMCSSV